jgi:large subunit ribosomal protein L25
MEQRELKVIHRKERGKGPSRRLRRGGLIPAVLYGPNTNPILLSLNPEDLRSVLSSSAGENTLISLQAEDDRKVSNKVVMLKDLQMNPLTREFIHADLYEVVMDEEIEVEVPLHLQGKSVGVQEGGILQQVSRQLRVRCMPRDIPEGIEIDISELEIGNSIHVRDIPLKEGMKIIAEPDFTVLTISAPMVEEKPEVVVEEKPEEEVAAEEKPPAVEEGEGAEKKE